MTQWLECRAAVWKVVGLSSSMTRVQSCSVEGSGFEQFND